MAEVQASDLMPMDSGRPEDAAFEENTDEGRERQTEKDNQGYVTMTYISKVSVWSCLCFINSHSISTGCLRTCDGMTRKPSRWRQGFLFTGAGGRRSRKPSKEEV